MVLNGGEIDPVVRVTRNLQKKGGKSKTILNIFKIKLYYCCRHYVIGPAIGTKSIISPLLIVQQYKTKNAELAKTVVKNNMRFAFSTIFPRISQLCKNYLCQAFH